MTDESTDSTSSNRNSTEHGMTGEHQDSNERSWIEASGLRPIIRTLRIAVHPSKLGLALIGVILTLIYGSFLDYIWLSSHEGIADHAVVEFISAQQFDRAYTEKPGTHGVFATWLIHEKTCVHDLLSSSIPIGSVAEGTPVGDYLKSHSTYKPLWNLAGMIYGVWWLGYDHPFFATLLGLGMLLIWGLAGGAICRSAAVEFARDERLTMSQALRFSRQHLFGGFFLAPCIPMGIIVATVGLLVAGGMVLRIPVLGDLISGLAFVFALLGGFAITALAIGLTVGGSLFWPAVAVEGSDAFDAFSRGLSYPIARPWKFLLYAVMMIVFAGLCWLFVNFFTFYMLKISHFFVGAGSSWFGWWTSGAEGAEVHKLDLLWPMQGVKSWYAWPAQGSLHWYEWFSAACVGVNVLLVIGLMWSFLASFYYSGSTIIYFLLRRDADETAYDDVCLEDEDGNT